MKLRTLVVCFLAVGGLGLLNQRASGQSYWTIDGSSVHNVLWTAAPSGTGYSYAADGDGGWVHAASENANTGGCRIEFLVTWSFHYNGTPWYTPHLDADDDNAGSAATGGYCEAGYSQAANVSIWRNTTATGNPFSKHETWSYLSGGANSATIVAGASAQSTSSGGTSTADSDAYFVLDN